MADNTAQPNTKTRPPIVVVLGHVDHGKTSLLDTIRETHVADRESGGITQHIGAYQVVANGQTITFLDTPGHEAFSAIRSRGAKVADVAVLVVAADEGVKPQTAEAAAIIQEEKIPYIVAINKIDKPGANPAKVKQDLAGINVLVEDWGGTVPVVEVSAKEKRNIPGLLEMVLLVAELEDLQEDLTLPAKGVIIESNLDKRRGYVATALVQKGVLSIGDWLVAGAVTGKVKSMEDFTGKMLETARPSQPVLITGWNKSPEIGREFQAAYSKDEAFDLAADNVDLAPLFSFLKAGQTELDPNKKYLKLVIKTDVSSSLEAIESALKQIKSDEVAYAVLNYDIGTISEADVKSALAAGGQVIGFRVPVESSARKLAEKEELKLATFDVIYELVEYIRREMGNLLAPEVSRNVLGKVRVLATFKSDARSQVVGGKVTSGKLVRGALCDVIRAGQSVMTAKVGQVQRNKEDVPEVAEGLETGIRLDMIGGEAVEIREGDTLEIYQEEKVSRSL
ncbi:MAG TPA: translation initiation factor IF-2 [Candidatus Paceibacterota bacterium]|nr:translation initiation factor IF-2 [Candidatus Paceibacterota bacterium]